MIPALKAALAFVGRILPAMPTILGYVTGRRSGRRDAELRDYRAADRIENRADRAKRKNARDRAREDRADD